MKNLIVNIVHFICILLFWLISGFIFRYNNEYYNLLNIPSFALNGKVISIIWFIIYILITISIVIIIRKRNIFKEKDYFYILLTNYISNQLFMFFFFYLMSPFLAFIDTVITCLTSIFLYIETKKLSKTSSLFLIPYVLYSIYALILMTSVYIMNF